MKCEPSEFSIDDLERAGEYFWDGVRNYQVRNMFRDQMRVGDKAIFYHSSTKDVGAVGEMEIIKQATPDPTQFDSKSKYFDAKSTTANPRWLGPTVSFVKKFNHLVSLEEIKNDSTFSDLALIKRGNRLSVIELSKKQYERLIKLGK
ncbi:MAG: EVE domain protein [Parcubacteria bacterium OLB19]|nr:MAG: EVE domain protein [Parcubacteria bacterium OLB19]